MQTPVKEKQIIIFKPVIHYSKTLYLSLLLIETFVHVQYRVVKDLRQILIPFVYNWSYDANYARQIFSLPCGNRLETYTCAETDPSVTPFKIYIILIILLTPTYMKILFRKHRRMSLQKTRKVLTSKAYRVASTLVRRRKQIAISIIWKSRKFTLA